MTALDERYGRREPVAGFIGRAAVGGAAAGFLGTLVFGIVAFVGRPDPGIWPILAYGVVFVCVAGAVVGILAALAGLAAERAGRSARTRTTALAVAGGATCTVLILLTALLGGPVAATYPPVVVVAVVCGAIGAVLLVRLRHRPLRQALRLPPRRTARVRA